MRLLTRSFPIRCGASVGLVDLFNLASVNLLNKVPLLVWFGGLHVVHVVHVVPAAAGAMTEMKQSGNLKPNLTWQHHQSATPPKKCIAHTLLYL